MGSCWPRPQAGAGWASMGALPLSSALCPAPMSVAPRLLCHVSREPPEPTRPIEHQSSSSRPAALSVSRRVGVLVPDLEEKQADPGAGLPFGTVEKGSHKEGGPSHPEETCSSACRGTAGAAGGPGPLDRAPEHRLNVRVRDAPRQKPEPQSFGLFYRRACVHPSG